MKRWLSGGGTFFLSDGVRKTAGATAGAMQNGRCHALDERDLSGR
jgi:hypothetical protein